MTDAARYWARGSQSYEDAITQAKAFGAPEEVIAELEALQGDEDFEVWPENWPAVEMFLRVQTQWRATMGVFYGLDYIALSQIMEVYQVEDRPSMLEQVQIVEFAALDAMSEKSNAR